MRRVIREIIDLSTGHIPPTGGPSCWQPVPPKAVFNTTVKVNGALVIVEGDPYNLIVPEHNCGSNKHPPGVAIGTGTVFIGGRRIIGSGDPISCGDFAGNGSQNVFVK